MDRDQELSKAIAEKDIRAITRLFFAGSPPELRDGFRTETELWDFKSTAPPASKSPESDRAWAALAALVLAFYNNRGGIIMFGVANDFTISRINAQLDSKVFNEKIWRYISDRIWVEYHRIFIEKDQSYVGLAIVTPRLDRVERFISSSPPHCKYTFGPRQSALREGDSCSILTEEAADALSRQLFLPTFGTPYIVDDTGFRILQPEYDQFTYRSELCESVIAALNDPRTAVTSLIGIGGAGKTALATWAALNSYEQKFFEFIVSITAKDRSLTTSGIQALEPSLGSFESLLNAILEVLDYKNLIERPVEEKHKAVLDIIADTKGLLYVDNLETIDDARIIRFLDELPIGVRALTTSRTARVKVSVRPINIAGLSDKEMVSFARAFEAQPGMAYVARMKEASCVKIGNACDGLPLAISWILKRSTSEVEAVSQAEALLSTGAKRDELLEFCFRRIFESMPQRQKDVLRVLSLYAQPLALEPIIAGCNGNTHAIDDIDELFEDNLVQRAYDEASNTYRFTVLPLVRSFVYADMVQCKLDRSYRKRLTDWFEAIDIVNPDQRLIERELRQGRQASDDSILALAQQAENRQDHDNAQRLYEYAMRVNRKNWRGAQIFAEFFRHVRANMSEALRYYQLAAEHAPKNGMERSLIFREWGMLLKDSGLPNATDLAIDKFEEARKHNPSNRVTIHSLGAMYARKMQWKKVIELLEPLLNSADPLSREKSIPLLLRAYEGLNDIVNVARLRSLSK